MEDIENMYIVKLLTGSVINTGKFLSIGENDITYCASKQLYENKQNIFLDLERNGNHKWAVVIDEEGTGRWQGSTFRNIQFISTSKEFCDEFKILKTRRERLRYDKMDLFEQKLESIRSNQNQISIDRLDKEMAILDEELKNIENRLEELN